MPWRNVGLVVTLSVAPIIGSCKRQPDLALQQTKINRAVSRVADELERRPGITCARDHDTPHPGETRNFFCGRQIGDDAVGVGAGSDRATQRRSPGWVKKQPFTQATRDSDYSITAQTSDGLFDVEAFQKFSLDRKRRRLPTADQVLRQVLINYDSASS